MQYPHRLFSPKTAISLLMVTMVAFGVTSSDFGNAKDAAKTAPAATQQKPVVTPSPEAKSAAVDEYVSVEPLGLLKEPEKYLNRKIAFEGTFNRFSDMGLDYKKAFRDSREYVNFMILRPDVNGHTIPLSELKLFFPRKKSEEVMELGSGDVISIKGTVFSTALNEPWVDVEKIDVIKKSETADRNHETPDF